MAASSGIADDPYLALISYLEEVKKDLGITDEYAFRKGVRAIYHQIDCALHRIQTFKSLDDFFGDENAIIPQAKTCIEAYRSGRLQKRAAEEALTAIRSFYTQFCIEYLGIDPTSPEKDDIKRQDTRKIS